MPDIGEMTSSMTRKFEKHFFPSLIAIASDECPWNLARVVWSSGLSEKNEKQQKQRYDTCKWSVKTKIVTVVIGYFDLLIITGEWLHLVDFLPFCKSR